jgi:YHS domain-containing protein
LRFLILLLLAYLVYRMLRGKVAQEIEKESTATETFQDPVCGVYLSEADAVVGNMEGKRYHFCSIGCLKQFEKIQQQR